MTTINTHGLTMTGLEEAAARTQALKLRSPERVQIGYDVTTGEVSSHYLRRDSDLMYHHPDVICGSVAHKPVTAQQIADDIARSVAYIAEERKQREDFDRYITECYNAGIEP